MKKEVLSSSDRYVHIPVAGLSGTAVALAPLADRHVRPALGFGDHRPERAVGHEDQAVPALGPRVAALARRGHGRRG